MPLPSVLLHDHLDGGLRVETILDLALQQGYEGLPQTEPAKLADWFDQSESGSLERYLRAFDVTVAVMQTSESIERVAYETVVDLAADGVVYAEIRFCPPHHTEKDLTHDDVIEAVAAGMRVGSDETGMRWGLIIDSLRHLHRSDELARLAVRHRHNGVVGFDLAGPEMGYPPEDHVAGFRHARINGLGVSIHAGEDAGRAGLAYMASAIDRCNAHRIGHGVQIIDDCTVSDGQVVDVGPVARRFRDGGIALEMCPASNLATARLQPEDHPFALLYRAGFNVQLNTDNRLMSNTSMSSEFEFARKYGGLSDRDLAIVTMRSMRSAFCPNELKEHLWATRIRPAYSELGVDGIPERLSL